jgi:hypothetical protein
MNRKTFFKAAAGRLLRLAEMSAAGWSAPGRHPQPEPPEDDLDALFLDAMRLGIDPAGIDRRHLKTLLAQRSPAPYPPAGDTSGKGGDAQPGADGFSSPQSGV